MPSLARGESSSASNPVLDLYTAVGLPQVLTDVAVLRFRVFDISTPAKRAVPVQVFPTTAGTFFVLDPTQADPLGHRLGVGHYFAPYTVDLAEPVGDHKIEWEFQQNSLSPIEHLEEEFFVKEASGTTPDAYCSVADVRNEGFVAPEFPDPPITDARIQNLIFLATRYVEKVTGRWFVPRTFTDPVKFMVDGKGGFRAGGSFASGTKVLHLGIPVIRLDKLEIELQGLLNPGLTEIDLGLVRVYNRHLSGMTQPDDREAPRIAFLQSRIVETVASGLFPAPHVFPWGRLNVHLQGVFGYTDPDGSPFGSTPLLIRQVTCRLVQRDLLLDADICEKLNMKNKYRIVSDKEDTTTIKLQNIWLKGGLTGDSEIDNILMAYKRPPRMAAV